LATPTRPKPPPSSPHSGSRTRSTPAAEPDQQPSSRPWLKRSPPAEPLKAAVPGYQWGRARPPDRNPAAGPLRPDGCPEPARQRPCRGVEGDVRGLPSGAGRPPTAKPSSPSTCMPTTTHKSTGNRGPTASVLLAARSHRATRGPAAGRPADGGPRAALGNRKNDSSWPSWQAGSAVPRVPAATSRPARRGAPPGRGVVRAQHQAVHSMWTGLAPLLDSRGRRRSPPSGTGCRQARPHDPLPGQRT